MLVDACASDGTLKEEEPGGKPPKLELSKDMDSKQKRSSPRKHEDKMAGTTMTMRDRSNVLSASFVSWGKS